MDPSAPTPPLNHTEGSPSSGLPTSSASARPPAVPPLVPDYDLLRRIGHGAYGDVWLARSQATDVLRAAKIVWRHTFEDDRPFKREFEGIQRFEKISREHPGQLALFHIGRNEAEGYFYYVMELADDVSVAADVRRLTSKESEARSPKSDTKLEPSHVGCYAPRTLRAELEHGRLPAARVLEIGLILTEALGHLHQNGLVHRDVKPSNVIFVNGRPKLADIGLVTDASDQCSIVGTEGYLPPEGPGTPPADIFALGKVLYEAATGLDRRELPKIPEDIRGRPDAKQVFELNEIILKACARDSDKRYQNCDEMHSELALLDQGKSVKRKRTRQQWLVVYKKNGVILISLAAIALLISLLARSPKPAAADAHGLLESGRSEDFRASAADLVLRAPRSAETYFAQSVVNWNDWNFPEALTNAVKAIQADPNYEPGHIWYAWLLLRFGWPEEARQQAKISDRLAPHNAIVNRTFGDVYFAERDYPKAIAQYKSAMTLESHPVILCQEIGWAYQVMNDYTNALNYFEKANGPNPTLRELRAALDQGGISGFWQESWELTKNNTNAEFYWKGVIRIHMSDTIGASKWLQRSYDTHESSGMGLVSPMGANLPIGELLFYGGWDNLHKNPEFTNLLNQVGFTKVMPPQKK